MIKESMRLWIILVHCLLVSFSNLLKKDSIYISHGYYSYFISHRRTPNVMKPIIIFSQSVCSCCDLCVMYSIRVYQSFLVWLSCDWIWNTICICVTLPLWWREVGYSYCHHNVTSVLCVCTLLRSEWYIRSFLHGFCHIILSSIGYSWNKEVRTIQYLHGWFLSVFCNHLPNLNISFITIFLVPSWYALCGICWIYHSQWSEYALPLYSSLLLYAWLFTRTDYE